MPREKDGFRDQLERLDQRFPGRETLKIEEAAEYLGIYRVTLLNDATFPAKKVGAPRRSLAGKYFVPKVALARWMA